MDKPKQLENIDTEALKKMCQDYIDFIDSDEYPEDNEFDHYIFECAIETVFGKDVWKFINSKI